MADPLSITVWYYRQLSGLRRDWGKSQDTADHWQAPTEFCDLLNHPSTLQALFDQTAATLKEVPGRNEATVTLRLIRARVVWGKLYKVVDEVNSLATLFLGTGQGVEENVQHRTPRMKWHAQKGRVEKLRSLAR